MDDDVQQGERNPQVAVGPPDFSDEANDFMSRAPAQP